MRRGGARVPGWRDTPAPVRGQILFRAQRRMEERREELAEALTREEGKTVKESRGEIQRAINILEFFAGEARRITGETIPSELPNNFCYTVKQPLGPVGIITPWNFPVAIPIWKIAPALVVGQHGRVQAGHADAAHRRAARGDLRRGRRAARRAEPRLRRRPRGRQRDRRHPAIHAVSFTGCNDVGTGLYGAAAARGIKCQCEMGGKNPVVVLADADLDLAVESTAQGAFGSTGQRCTATTARVIVESIANEFVERLEARDGVLVVGNGLEPGHATWARRWTSRSSRPCSSYIEIGSARAPGSSAAATGSTRRGRDHGYFVEPTIFDRVDAAHAHRAGGDLRPGAVRDPRAGLRGGAAVGQRRPVRPVRLDLHDRRRVDVPLRRPARGRHHPRQLAHRGGEAHMPFGGIKATGVGLREMGRVAIEFFTELKIVYVDYTGGRGRRTSIETKNH